jgi:2,5-diamino-6-(ribosylamino)-4(3H)-pyrimidinone 5'-phosphate reductase
MRQRLFAIQDAIELKPEEFDRYWPFIDNVWVRQHRAGIDRTGRVSTDYYACRLQRPTYTPRKQNEPRPEGKPARKKQTREGGTCQVRIKTVRYTGGYQKVTISRVGEHEHSHDLDHMDQIKRNSILMEVARAEVMKGFMPASVFTIMNEDKERLEAAGGRYLTRNDVRNASQAWRQAHKDALAVHPGYKYDHGNGIVRATPPGAPSTAPANSASTIGFIPNSTTAFNQTPASPYSPAPSLNHKPTTAPNVDPAATPNHMQAPIGMPLPADTLYFPPDQRAFLAPYLPPNDPIPPNGLPFITLTYATSMDSFLAIAPHTPTALSGPATKAMTHYLRSAHDAILVGVGTAIADDPSLNCRLAGSGGYGGLGWDFQPRPVVIDPGARWFLTPDRAVIRAAAAGRGRGPWIVMATGYAMDPARLEFVRHYGGKYLGMPDMDANYRLRWEAIFRALAAEGIRSVMVEGGGVVINELLRPPNAGLVGSVVVTVAPTYLGTGGVVVCPNRTVDPAGRVVPVARFRDVRWTPVGEDVVMCGRLGSGGAGGAEGPRPGEAGLSGVGTAGVGAAGVGAGSGVVLV